MTPAGRFPDTKAKPIPSPCRNDRASSFDLGEVLAAGGASGLDYDSTVLLWFVAKIRLSLL